MKKLFCIILVALCFKASAQTGVKISDLPAQSGDPGAGYVPLSIGGITKKVSPQYFGVWDFYMRNDSLFKLRFGQEIFITKPGQGGTGESNDCESTFDNIAGDPHDNQALDALFSAKQPLIPQGNSLVDTNRKYWDGYHSWSSFDTSARAAMNVNTYVKNFRLFYNYPSETNLILNQRVIANIDTFEIFGGVYRYNTATRGTKPGIASGGTVYIYVQNDENYLDGEDRITYLVIDNNGQFWTRIWSGSGFTAWNTPVYSFQLAGYLPLSGGTINGYLSMVNKASLPTTPAVGQNTIHFDGQGLMRIWSATGNWYRFDTAGMGVNNITLNVKAIADLVASGGGSTPFDSNWQPYAGAGTWDGTLQPATLNAKFRYIRQGNEVKLWLRGSYTTAGTSNTNASFTWPSGVPLPDNTDGIMTGASAQLYPGTGGFGQNNFSVANNSKVFIRINSTNTGSVLTIDGASQTAKYFWIFVDYTCVP